MHLELLVGDPHVVVDELEDAARLFDLIYDTAVKYKVHRITLLGDLHHNFSVTNLKVMGFYRDALWKLDSAKSLYEDMKGVDDNNIQAVAYKFVWGLVGNHDQPGDGSSFPHALQAYSDIICIVDKPILNSNVLYVPYMHNPNLFYEACKAKCGTVVCHQDFNGATYDNGYYSPFGLDPSKVTVPIISGHIHTPQRFGNVWYPGAPRWRTISDAGCNRAIWVVRVEDNGVINPVASIDTSDVCRVIRTAVVSAGNGAEAAIPLMNEKDDWRLTIQGPADFVREKVEWLQKNAPFARYTTIVLNDRINVKESDGIEVAFGKYLSKFTPKFGTDKAHLEQLAKQRLYG